MGGGLVGNAGRAEGFGCTFEDAASGTVFEDAAALGLTASLGRVTAGSAADEWCACAGLTAALGRVEGVRCVGECGILFLGGWNDVPAMPFSCAR